MVQVTKIQRLRNAKKLIQQFFEESTDRFFTFQELGTILEKHKPQWILGKTTKTNEFISFLKDAEIIIREIRILMPDGSMAVRYAVGNYEAYELAASIYPGAHFSHYTALYLHQLTNTIPKSVYLLKEDKYVFSNRSGLVQKNIDLAFSRPMRKTNNIATFDDVKIYMLLGKRHSEEEGIEELEFSGKMYRITSIERTLIDIVVRPEYSGGASEILDAYKLAKGRVSVNLLVKILKDMDFTYPYHQSIGYLLERAGYKESMLKLVESIGIEYDFYLTYGMKDKDYSARWRLFFPKGL